MRYQHGRDNWATLHARIEDVEQVRQALQATHDRQCAYCEAALEDRWHIEHLWPKSHYPQRTFDWENLFASCMRKNTCGTHKDQGGRPYDPADLIDPGREDPDDYLFFAQDGTAQPRVGLTARRLRRAEETIRVFNLNAPALLYQRAQVIRTLLCSEPDVVEVLATFPPEDRWAWVRELIEDYCAGCFQTPVRHLLSLGGP
jgi:uncharacterized protein (TIGR02646 family)